MDLGVAGPQRGIAGKAETGKACPYCRFPLKEGSDIVRCGACHACHHADCWQDNAGCAVVACAGGPSTDAHARTAEMPQAARVGPASVESHPVSPQPSGPPPPPSWQQPPQRSRASGPWLVAAALIVGLAGAGVAVAVALGHKSPKTTTTIVSAPADPGQPGDTATDANQAGADASTTTSDTAETDTGTSEDPSTTDDSSNGLLPAESQDQMTQDIQQMLLEFHQDISSGDFQDAWSLLSARKQQQSLRESGYNGWVSNQRSLGDALDPSGLEVSIVGTDPGTGVATVDVTGMTWTPSGGAPCQWSGITWVKYENGSWHYDPGYSTTPRRRKQWGPPANTSSPAYTAWKSNTWSQLMGGQCVPPS